MNRRLAAVLVAALATVALTAVPAQAATSTVGPGLDLKSGTHHKGSLHAGAYWLDGHEMYCVTYGAALGDGPTRTGSRDARTTYIVDKWGTTRDAIQAADVDLAINSLAGSAAFNADYPGYLAQLPDKGARVKAMLAEAVRLAGPWKVTVTAPKAVPGSMVLASVTVTSASGFPVPGVRPTVHGVGAVVSAASATNGAGVATVEVRPSALTYTLSASISSPGVTVWTNTPSSGHQVLVGAGPNVTVNGSACATVCPVSATVTVHAQCDDKGRHQVDVTWTVEDLPGSYVGTVNIGGHASQVEVAAGETRTVSGQVTAGQDVTVGYQILDSTGAVLVTATLDGFTQR